MQLHGTIEINLVAALRSANRLRDQRVHRDTLQFWTDLVWQARCELSSSAVVRSDLLSRLVGDLELRIAQQSS
jgi:hypothetical protein